MSSAIPAAVQAPDTFVTLSKELSKAGLGFTKSSKDAIESVAQRGLALTQASTTVSKDEVDFYRALRSKAPSSTETLEDIETELQMISLEKPVIALEENAPIYSANFLTLNEKQRFEFLNSADLRTAHATAKDIDNRIKPIKDRTLRLLYAATGSKAETFKDSSLFVEHRNRVINVLNTVVDFQNDIADIGNSLKADELYQSVVGQPKNGIFFSVSTRTKKLSIGISSGVLLLAALGLAYHQGYLDKIPDHLKGCFDKLKNYFTTTP